MLPDFIQFIIWGHEHESLIQPEPVFLSVFPAVSPSPAVMSCCKSRALYPSLTSMHRSLTFLVLLISSENNTEAHLTQPGSTVQTSFIAAEAVPKHMVLTSPASKPAY